MRHERTVEAVQRSPDGTVLQFRVRESYDDGPAAPAAPAALALPVRTEAARRAPYVYGATAVLCAAVAAVPVALAVLP